MPIAPAVVHQKRTSRPQVNRIDPAFPARMGYGLFRALPGVTSSLAPVVSGLTMHLKARSGRMHLPKLGASLGRRNDATSPSAPIFAKGLVGTRGPAKF